MGDSIIEFGYRSQVDCQDSGQINIPVDFVVDIIMVCRTGSQVDEFTCALASATPREYLN
ncbi:hypothetical protein B0G80_7548 [Paraburkholderia sp. BL6669N2]|nr:hypothetical protein B0G80_7548 [Paraburkholderia sp. BL6669N2]